MSAYIYLLRGPCAQQRSPSEGVEVEGSNVPTFKGHRRRVGNGGAERYEEWQWER